jgi:hypothetical protein
LYLIEIRVYFIDARLTEVSLLGSQTNRPLVIVRTGSLSGSETLFIHRLASPVTDRGETLLGAFFDVRNPMKVSGRPPPGGNSRRHARDFGSG